MSLIQWLDEWFPVIETDDQAELKILEEYDKDFLREKELVA